MLLKDKMKNGQLYREFGHENIEDQEYEKEIERQRLNCKARMFEYNHCHPDNKKEKQDILRGLLGHAGENIWIELPLILPTAVIPILVKIFMLILIWLLLMILKFILVTM